ncbi:MAG TPA: hypothetical protein VIE43_23200 [Thermoanaerobaculia bacterium]|jgi:hypothetical protein|nr:hypothetical protein [Thermoanaerobaculia bacterium]
MSEGQSELEGTVQDELHAVIEDLRRIEARLRALQRRLRTPVQREGDDERDILTDLRSAIECVLVDSLGPAVRDLTAAALYTLNEAADR